MNDLANKQPNDMTDDKSFSVSKKIDGVEKTVSGEKVENGWILTIRKEWQDTPKEGSDYGEWHNESKKFISVENPLNNLKGKAQTDMQDAESMLSSILGQGMLMV